MAIGIWKITKHRPFSANRVLTGQIRRAGLSVVSNIAEGLERGSRAELGRLLKIAKGSCGEVRAQMLVASDLNYISNAREHEEVYSATRHISADLSVATATNAAKTPASPRASRQADGARYTKDARKARFSRWRESGPGRR
jgi:four helix bundle protein